MAKLIAKKCEANPFNEDGTAWIGYFEGAPTEADLKDAGGGGDGFSKPERADDEVSRRAGLERWFLAQYV